MATVFKGFKYCNELAGARGGDIGEMWCMYDGGNIGINKLSVKRGDFISWGVNGWKLEPNMKFLTTLDSFDMSQLAPEFDSTETYQPGDVVVYDNELYVCVNAHTGDWDATDFTPTDMTTAMAAIGDEIKILEVTWDSGTSSYVFPAITDVVEAVDNYESVVLRYTSPTGVRRFYLLNEFKRNTAYYFVNVEVHEVFKIELDGGNLVWDSTELYDGVLNNNSKNAPQTMVVDTEFGKIGGSIAPAYDATATYVVGDLVMYARRLYECTTDISTPEAWNSTHWTRRSVSDFKPFGALADGGTLTDGVSVEVSNNKLSTLSTSQSALTLNVTPSSGTVPNFAVEVTASVACTVTVTSTVGGTPTTLKYAESAGNELEAGKTYQLTCVGSCWTLAEFTQPTP